MLLSNKQVFQSEKLGTLPAMNYYSSSQLPAGILDSTDFAYVVENLDTAEKTAAYTKEKFTFYDRKTCIGQTPSEFFTERKGDCLSYANFFSYVLSQHGYDVKKVSFKYHEGGNAWGHVVTLFTDRDGQLKYVTTPDQRVFRNVSSIDDLIAKEQTRLEIPTLDIKNGKPNVVTIAVGDLSSCH